MARARAAENFRSRSKASQIEELTRGIGKLQELLIVIDDLSQEGFPYQEAARAKAELQFRESVRRIFGDRSPEFQSHRNHKLRTSNKAETGQSIAAIKDLIQTLEEKKLELQGMKAPQAATPPAEKSPTVPLHMTLVPPTAEITMAPQPANSTPSMTLSVAMTTNLATSTGTPHASSPPTVPEGLSSVAQPPTPAAPLIATPTAVSVPPPKQPRREEASSPRTTPSAPPTSSDHDGNIASEQPAIPATPTPSTAPSPAGMHAVQSPPPLDKPVLQDEAHSSEPGASPHPLHIPDQPPTPYQKADVGPIHTPGEQEPVELIRKVCLRFHSVARQLRLRKDYRATLEVEDDYDLQDLLCALLKVEFDEVLADEWTPPYAGGAPRTTLLLNSDRIAVVAKKTRSGLTTKEIADQVAADSAYYGTREKCTTLFCFIYDPEGRIGSPKRLETDLTSVSDRYTVEVLVAPR